MMLARPSLGRSAQRAAALPCRAQWSSRTYATATPASGSALYQSSDASGLKIAAADTEAPTATLALVAKAGTRYDGTPGLVEGLSAFAFKSTANRSALRMTRESELLGGQLSAYHTREALVLQAKCLKEDVPFYAELLAEVASKTIYLDHEFGEEVVPYLSAAQKTFTSSSTSVAINAVHSVAFHSGLGTDLHVLPYAPLAKYISAEKLQTFSQSAYSKSNVALVASGAASSELTSLGSDLFGSLSTGSGLSTTSSKYHGGEIRIAHSAAASTVVIAFPGSSLFSSGSASYKPEISVISALLGGQSSIKWSPGFTVLSKVAAAHPGVSISTSPISYTDAGLLSVTMTGSAENVGPAVKAVVDAIKKVASGDIAKEDLAKAIALAKFDALEAGETSEMQLLSTGLSLLTSGKTLDVKDVTKGISGVTAQGVGKLLKTLLDGKASYAAVGDLHVLPWAESTGLKV